jgi:leader peptidase (prepilin peptidase)/N-methyltransferase
MIPILSFALQKGQCRECKLAIPRVTILLEVSAVLAVFLAQYVAQTNLDLILSTLLLWLLLALAVSDALWFRLPDALTAALFLCGFGLTLLNPNRDLGMHLAAAVLGVVVFIGLRWGYAYLRGVVGLGMGDVKLMAGIGMVVGVYELPHTLLVASSAALIYALCQAWSRDAPLTAGTRLAFGSFLCLGTGVVWFTQRSLFWPLLF